MRFILLILSTLLCGQIAIAQGCCSGGAGSPIAGGAASGVLLPSQMELSTSLQSAKSDLFYQGSEISEGNISNYKTSYNYLRADYGLSEKLTFSIASGYHINKSYFDGMSSVEKSSKGLGDVVVLPRYNIYNNQQDNYRTEITLGVGAKISLAEGNDSNLVASSIDMDIYSYSSPIIQRSTGGNDLLLYAYYFKGYHKRAFRVFANGLYIKKGYNSSGLKFGDYASMSVFVSKTILRKIGLTAQIKAEHIQGIEAVNSIDVIAEYNIYEESTGSNKLFFIPQINYSHKSFTFFGMTELPLYQFMHGTQIASQWQFTMGVNYRFLTKK